MTPTTTKQWTVASTEKDFDGLSYGEGEIPKVGDNEVLVKLEAASLNYRDIIIPKGTYPFPIKLPVVAGSDGAGSVVSTGLRVSRFQPGDKVVTLFTQKHIYGPITRAVSSTGLGGLLDGTFRQYGVFSEEGLVHAPRNLNSIEAATLTCAGLTAWNALYPSNGAGLKPGQTVLVQGTGGVSMFALQFAKAAGARVIATTSSAAKADKLKKLGADHVINYKEDTNWGETARKLTPHEEGVDVIIEVGGAGTQAQSVKAIKFEGTIAIIGLLTGAKAKDAGEQVPAMSALSAICSFRGVLVGSRQQMEDMIAAIEHVGLRPLVDETVFPLEKLREAYEYLWDQKHFGKVAIRIE